MHASQGARGARNRIFIFVVSLLVDNLRL